jgi:hypothetical protein
MAGKAKVSWPMELSPETQGSEGVPGPRYPLGEAQGHSFLPGSWPAGPRGLSVCHVSTSGFWAPKMSRAGHDVGPVLLCYSEGKLSSF